MLCTVVVGVQISQYAAQILDQSASVSSNTLTQLKVYSSRLVSRADIHRRGPRRIVPRTLLRASLNRSRSDKRYRVDGSENQSSGRVLLDNLDELGQFTVSRDWMVCGLVFSQTILDAHFPSVICPSLRTFPAAVSLEKPTGLLAGVPKLTFGLACCRA